MRNLKTGRTAVFIPVVLLLLASGHTGFAYPPDNAAVLYYRACIWHQQNDARAKMLYEFLRGRIDVNEEIKKHIEINRKVTDFVITAAGIRHCDWGLDESKGMSMLSAPISTLRKLARLILADAKILSADGDYKTALSRCVSVYRLARHMKDSTLITYLVGSANKNSANRCIRAILSDMPQDLETLRWLKHELADMAEDESVLFKAAVNIESKSILTEMQRRDTEAVLALFADEDIVSRFVAKSATEQLVNSTEQFFEKSQARWKDYIYQVKGALDLPYTQAYLKLKQLSEETEKDLAENPDMLLTNILTPAFHKAYSVAVRDSTYYNAIRTAVEIYKIKAETGKLPDNLPAGLPKDLFSGDDFGYQKTDDGFILTCKSEYLFKNKIQQYEFKVRR